MKPQGSPKTGSLPKMAQRVVVSDWFSHTVTAVIVFNAAVIGLNTWPAYTALHGNWLTLANQLCLSIFIVEMLFKLTAHYPRLHRFFASGWNLFDFSVILFSLLPENGELATVARLARLLRVMRLVSAMPELRLLVSTLVRSIPSMLNVVVLMSVIFYIYAVAGYHLFHDIDPTHWRNLGISLLSLFRIVTLEDWTDIMYNAMEHYWWAWAFFVSFVIFGTFVVINLFIAVMLNNLEEAKRERLRDLTSPPKMEELVRDLKQTQDALRRLAARLDEQSDAKGQPTERQGRPHGIDEA